MAVVLAASQKSYEEAEVAQALRTTFPNGMDDYGCRRQDRGFGVNEVVKSEADHNDEEIDALISAEPESLQDEVLDEADAIQVLATWKEERKKFIKDQWSRGAGLRRPDVKM